MPRRRNKGIPKGTDSSPPVPKEQVGLLVTAELEEALTECKKKVESISKICRAVNKKFRWGFIFFKVIHPIIVIFDNLEITSLISKMIPNYAYTD